MKFRALVLKKTDFDIYIKRQKKDIKRGWGENNKKQQQRIIKFSEVDSNDSLVTRNTRT